MLPVPKKIVEACRRMGEEAGKVWREYGALEFVECIAEDVRPGKLASFPQCVQLEKDESAVFSWVVFESRQARDRINEQAMKGPRVANMDPKSMPFDGKSMVWGGFEVLLKL